MCTRPIKVRNPKKSINGLVDKAFIYVPCGDCWQCRLERKNSAWLKMHYEFEDCKAHGGFAYFLTLTYNNVNL